MPEYAPPENIAAKTLGLVAIVALAAGLGMLVAYLAVSAWR